MSASKLDRKLCQQRGCYTPWRNATTKRCHRHRPDQAKPKRPLMPAVCTVAECPNPVPVWGRCNTHQYEDYLQLHPEVLDMIELGLTQWIDPNDAGCWVYTNEVTKDRHGYGKFMPDGRWAMVHKWLSMHLVGAVPDGHQLHHECRNRACCRPGHLTPVTPEEHRKLTAAHAEFQRMFPGTEIIGPDRSYTDRERRFAAVYGLPADTILTEQDMDGLLRPVWLD